MFHHFSSLSGMFLLKIHLFVAAESVAVCRLSLVASSRGCSLAVEHRLLIAMPALVVASRLERAGVSVIAAHGLSRCGTQA